MRHDADEPYLPIKGFPTQLGVFCMLFTDKSNPEVNQGRSACEISNQKFWLHGLPEKDLDVRVRHEDGVL